jgi:hypothetical protein
MLTVSSFLFDVEVYMMLQFQDFFQYSVVSKISNHWDGFIFFNMMENLNHPGMKIPVVLQIVRPGS